MARRPTVFANVWQWKVASALAASLALVAVLWILKPGGPTSRFEPGAPDTQTTSPGDPREIRGRPGSGSQPELLFPEEGSIIQVGEAEFHWSDVPRSLFYEISVTTADGDLLWGGRVEGVSTRLPDGVSLSAGQEYFVWIRAYLPEGKTVKSKAVGFRTED
jgi:hypothetical protein